MARLADRSAREGNNVVQINIDRRGRLVRATSGCVCLVISMLLVFGLIDVSGRWRWIAVAALTLMGLFQLFEARRGWCVVRACGIRTPL